MTDTVYLRPESSFLGEPPRSDTLFGAICWAVKLSQGEENLKELLAGFFENDPPFLHTSTFPFIEQGSDKRHFFPFPLSEPLSVEPENLEELNRAKETENVEYVTDELYNKVLSGELGKETIYRSDRYRMTSGYLYREGEMPPKKFPLFDQQNVQRTTIDRLTDGTHEGRLFYSEQTRARKEVGLFFLLEGDEEELDKVRIALRFLQDRGLGGNVSVGKGDFEVAIEQGATPIEEPEGGDYFTNLSLFYPKEDNDSKLSFNKAESWFETERRRGRLESSLVETGDVWKDAVLVYREGSVFPDFGEAFYGMNPVVKREPFDVQYYGYGFPVRLARE